MPSSIFSRKRDLAYLVFFALHIPLMLTIDLTALYPSHLTPAFMISLREYYVATYHDRNFVAPTAWFCLYVWMEALYHLPLSVYAIGALLRDDPKAPLHLLIFAVQAGLTTATCIAYYLSWDITSAQKYQLGLLYVPYLALAVVMGVDMFGRLERRIERTRVVSKKVA